MGGKWTNSQVALRNSPLRHPCLKGAQVGNANDDNDDDDLQSQAPAPIAPHPLPLNTSRHTATI